MGVGYSPRSLSLSHSSIHKCFSYGAYDQIVKVLLIKSLCVLHSSKFLPHQTFALYGIFHRKTYFIMYVVIVVCLIVITGVL